MRALLNRAGIDPKQVGDELLFSVSVRPYNLRGVPAGSATFSAQNFEMFCIYFLQDQSSISRGGGTRPSFAEDSIDEQPYDSSDNFTLHPLLQKVRQRLLSVHQQNAVLECQSNTVGKEAGNEEQMVRSGFHMLRFCAGTAAALPHHKLATLRAEAASPDCIPTDWLDFALVAHSYKLDTHSSQSTRRNPPPHTKACAGHYNAEVPDCGRMQRSNQEERLPPSVEHRECLFPSQDMEVCGNVESRSLGSDAASLSSKEAWARDQISAEMRAEISSLSMFVRPGHSTTHPQTGGRCSPMRRLAEASGQLCDLPSTPITSSKLPQCGIKPLGPRGSPAGSHERPVGDEGVSAIKNSFLSRSSKPETPRSTLSVGSDAPRNCTDA